MKLKYWQNSSNAAGTHGLLDELEFYELLDLDASGEQDTDITIDNMSEAVLMSLPRVLTATVDMLR